MIHASNIGYVRHMTARTITTSATARRKETPDLATVEVAVLGEGSSMEEARTTARDRKTMIRESVTAVSADQIQTVDLQVQNTDEMFDPATDAAYQATERLHIECVPETAEDVAIEVSRAGGSIQTVHFYLHAEVHQKLKDEALLAAMERARHRAEILAAAEGLAVAEVQNVSTIDRCTGMDGIIEEALDAESGQGLDPEPVTVSETVEATFELVDG